MRSEITLRGVMAIEKNLLDNFVTPFTEHREDFFRLLLMETDGIELLHSDPRYLGQAIHSWSVIMCPAWKHIMDALLEEYSPIENYDRKEEWSEKNKRNDNFVTAQDGESHATGTVHGETENTQTESKTGYNSYTFVPGVKEEYTSETNTETTDDANTANRIENNGTSENDMDHNGRIHGNIGVTTNQQMITAEIELRCRYQVEIVIIQQFKAEFCLQIY